MKLLKHKLLMITVIAAFVVALGSGNIMAYSYSSYGGNSYYSSGNSYSNYSSGGSYYSSGNSYSNYYGSGSNNRSSYNYGNTGNSSTGSSNTGTSNTGTSQSGGSGIVFKQGMRTTGIKYLETKLKRLGYNVKVDGFYGYDTTVAVKKFQRTYGLSVTGKMDARTRNKITAVYVARVKNNTGTNPAPAPAPAPTPQPDPQPAPQPAPQPGTNYSQMEQQMLNLMNQARANNGVKPLQMDSRLVNLARMKSQDMIDNNYFSHSSPTYGSPFKMLNDHGVSYRTAGENLAGNNSVQAAFQALMNSAGHRRNILNPDFTRVGIGIKKGGPYGMMFTQLFTG